MPSLYLPPRGRENFSACVGHAIEPGVEAIAPEELGVGADLDDAALVQNHDAIGVANG